MASRVVLCLLAALAAWPAAAQGNANATVCAADDDSAFSPEQRISACDALIKARETRPRRSRRPRESGPGRLVRRQDEPSLRRSQSRHCARSEQFASLSRTLQRLPLDRQARPRARRRERGRAARSQGCEAFDNRGDVFVEKGQYERAIQDYDEALRLDPKLSLAFRDRGAAYYFTKDYNARSRTMTKRSSSIPAATAPTPTAARLIRARPQRGGDRR